MYKKTIDVQKDDANYMLNLNTNLTEGINRNQVDYLEHYFFNTLEHADGYDKNVGVADVLSSEGRSDNIWHLHSFDENVSDVRYEYYPRTPFEGTIPLSAVAGNPLEAVRVSILIKIDIEAASSGTYLYCWKGLLNASGLTEVELVGIEASNFTNAEDNYLLGTCDVYSPYQPS